MPSPAARLAHVPLLFGLVYPQLYTRQPWPGRARLSSQTRRAARHRSAGWSVMRCRSGAATKTWRSFGSSAGLITPSFGDLSVWVLFANNSTAARCRPAAVAPFHVARRASRRVSWQGCCGMGTDAWRNWTGVQRAEARDRTRRRRDLRRQAAFCPFVPSSVAGGLGSLKGSRVRPGRQERGPCPHIVSGTAGSARVSRLGRSPLHLRHGLRVTAERCMRCSGRQATRR